MREYAVVGGGIGGASIAKYLSHKGRDVVLFEKESYLGGCSSTFSHAGFSYNTGATTLVGYEEGREVKEFFDSVGFTPRLVPTEPTITIIQGEKITPRHKELDAFVAALEANYSHAKHAEFWRLVHDLCEEFYKMRGYYYSNKNIFAKARSLMSFSPLFFKFFTYLRTDAKSFIKKFYGDVSDEYMKFLDAQIMIVAQAKSEHVNFLTAALSLGYTFGQNYYVVGGFSKLFEEMMSGVEVRTKSEIKKIVPRQKHYELHLKNEIIECKNLILNSTVYDSGKLFESGEIKVFYRKYEKLNNHQSSFMLYMTIQSDADFAHHYQIIEARNFSHAISNSLFVSVSDKNDNEISPKGYYTITASVHTDVRFWYDKAAYKAKKRELEYCLKELISQKLGIRHEQIVHLFSATPTTFERYIKRAQLGGNAIIMQNILPRLPSNDTPFRGLYHVGDSVYPAQGWIGVMLGVKNLQRLLHV